MVAGVYQLPASNIIDLTRVLIAGPGPAEKRITLIEGWTISDMAEELADNELVDRENFISLISKPVANGYTRENYPILYSKPDSVDLEGYLFPDTYRIFLEAEDKDIVSLLLNTLSQRFSDQMLSEIDARGKSIHEILTMASIIEKEVRTERDRRLVSGVLWSRISAGIPLQVDSSVNYITGNNDPAVSLADTRIDNRFNTYKYYGLPPGPISNPGLSAIMAAIYPTDSEYVYYLSTPAGETIFSTTLEEHNTAKARYLK